jgi:hypothetical protein
VDCTTILQIAHKENVEVIERLLCFSDGVHIEQRLGRMLVSTVACIDNRYRGNLAGKPSASLQRMPHDNKIAIVADSFDGVPERFTLGDTG